ncbi:hypothetical protein FQR65_LT06060 [Abscondita terminalis]|nr:hypothetical protein FQR65_LT06060 [Abscondita terminalis]
MEAWELVKSDNGLIVFDDENIVLQHKIKISASVTTVTAVSNSKKATVCKQLQLFCVMKEKHNAEKVEVYKPDRMANWKAYFQCYNNENNEFPDSPIYPSIPATPALPEAPQIAKQYGGTPSRKRNVESNTNVAVRVSNVNAAIDKLDKLTEKNMSILVDEFDVFGKHTATQLRQLPLHNALLCKKQIEAVVKQQRLRLLLQNDAQSPRYSNSNIGEKSSTDDTFAGSEATSDIIAEPLANL